LSIADHLLEIPGDAQESRLRPQTRVAPPSEFGPLKNRTSALNINIPQDNKEVAPVADRSH
jgi:hypothetical protein